MQVISKAVPELDRSLDTVTAPNKPDVAEPDGCEHPLLVLPLILSRTEVPFPYRYRGFAKKAVRTEIAWTSSKKMMIVSFDAGTVPQPRPRDQEDLVHVRLPTCPAQQYHTCSNTTHEHTGLTRAQQKNHTS